MSLNQSRVEKNEAQQRKPVRSGSSAQQRSSSNATGKGGTAAGGTAPPISSSSIYSSGNRSVKKSNGPGGQSQVNAAASNSESSVARTVQNGAHAQSQTPGPALPGTLDAAVSGMAKPADSSVSRSARALPKAPSSHSAAAAPESAAPATPKGDISRAFPLQFGTISPGFMNGMQIPARTSSAPPNLDEQKRDQVRHDSFRAVPTAPIPTVPKQPQRRKDVGVNQSNAGESHPSVQTKRDGQVQITAPPAAQKSTVLPLAAMSMPMSYQQQQVPVQFSSPSSQIQSQGVSTTALQMPLPLTVGNAPQVQQPVFVPGLQSHPLQPQGMLHQGQTLGFTSQLGHQMAPQLNNRSISIAPQFAQQAGKFGGPRKAVKITHPDTHEEVRLDKRTDSYSDVGSSGPMTQILISHANQPPRSQPIPSFPTAHQIKYYSPMPPNSYTGSSLFFPTQTSLPLTSNQMTPSSSAPRYNFSVGPGGQTVSYLNPSPLDSLPVTKTGALIHGHSEQVSLESTHDGHGLAVSAPMASVQVTVKPAVTSSPISITQPANKESSSSHQQRVGNEGPRLIPSGSGEIGLESSVQHLQSVSGSPSSVPLPASVKQSTATHSVVSRQRPGPVVSSTDTVFPAVDAAPVVTITDNRRELVKRSDSDKKQNKKDQRHSHQQHQAETSDSAGSLKFSSLKISKDVGSRDVDTRPVTTISGNLQSPLEVVGASSSVLSLPSIPEHNVSSEVGVSEAKTMPAISGISEATSGVPAEGSQATSAGCLSASEAASDGVHIEERGPCEPSNLLDLEAEGKVSENLDTTCTKQEDVSSLEHGLKQEASETSKQTSETPDAVTIQDDRNTEEPTSLPASENSEGSKETELVSHKQAAADSAEEMVRAYPLRNTDIGKLDANNGGEICSLEVEYSDSPVGAKFPNPVDVEVASSSDVASADAHTNSSEDFSKTGHQEVAVLESNVQSQEIIPPVSTHVTQKHEGRCTDSTSGGLVSASSSVSKDKPSVEASMAKNTAGKKKKKKDILSRADAAGATSDLYTAYKAPKEKQEAAIASDSMEVPVGTYENQISADDAEKDIPASEEDSHIKAEVDDWEDAAEISTPKLKISENGEQVSASGVTGKKKYSRDFLLTFSDQFTDLPVGFKFRSDVAVVKMSVQVPVSYLDDRESYSNSARILDRPTGSRLDRRVSGMTEEDRWNKPPGPLGPVCDIRVEVGHGGPAGGYRLAQGGNIGVLRNPRGQLAGQYVGGILSGPMQSLSAQGGMPRNNVDADRWQRAPGSQKGLIPSPHTPLQVMHKAERKYEVGKVSDEEETKQRQLKAILNKLTPQNFDKLFEQVKEVNIDSAATLTGVISQIFDKALMEPTFCEMYANFCDHLAGELPGFSEDNEKITFKRLLLNKCQEEFERGEREQAEANRVEEEGEIKRSDEEREEKKVQARRRMLGNIRLIGELYKKKMLTERIMHECIKKLLGQYQNPDEEDVEALCKLMSTIGEMIDHPKAKEHMDAYFDRMAKLANNQKLSSRVRFMLKDAIDLRKNRWQQRRKVEGPKKIEEVHRDAAQERQLQVGGRMPRGSNINMPARRGQPLDYGSRGSAGLAAPGGQPMGGLRTMPPQLRGYGMQDVRLDDKHSFESRTLSVPLSQRPIDDDSITLGPQGGLARGMSIRGQPPISSGSLTDASANSGDVRRMALVGPNGYGSAHSVSDWPPYNSREELMPRGTPDRFSGASVYDQSNFQERIVNRDSRNLDRSFDRSTGTVHTLGRSQGSLAGTQNAPSDNRVWPEERLRQMSITAIREFYGANDETEVARCIKDLNSPNFYPTMVSLWVMDSFERKDIDRDLLAKLLVYLCKPREGILNQVQLLKGFEYVFSTLEDAVYDAPRATEFLGRILAQVIVENTVPLREIGRLIHEGGEAPGQLRQLGLAADVLGSILEVLRKEKGEAVLNEICTRSNLRLEDFRPPDPNKSRRLDAFI